MKFAKVEKTDLIEINKLIESEFPYTKKSERPIEERFKDENFIFFKLADNKKLIGFAEFQLCGRSAFLRGLAIMPDYRKKGYGKILLQNSILQLTAIGICEIKLLVAKDNLAAKKLYKCFGFEKTNTQPQNIAGKIVEEMKLIL